MTREELVLLLSYDPNTGQFRWRISKGGRAHEGDVAGTVLPSGYRRIKIDDRRYYSHRLAWLYVTGEWPAAEIDHINCDPGDNRWGNLRLATSSQNKANSRKRADNTSGLKGVTWDGRNRKWQAQIMAGGRRRSLGYFADPAAAHAAYVAAATKTFGDFARI
jgi:hypothetical protein